VAGGGALQIVEDEPGSTTAVAASGSI